VNGVLCSRGARGAFFPIAIVYNEDFFNQFSSKVRYWVDHFSKSSLLVPKNELSAFWGEVSRLNAEHISKILSVLDHRELMSVMLEPRLLAENSKLIGHALNVGLQRAW
jgi:hypothetical protein